MGQPGGYVAIVDLPSWTLGARLDQEALDFVLSDGRRLAVRSRRPAALLHEADRTLPADRLLGEEMATRLAGSPPRSLNVQVDAALDMVEWEALRLGETSLGEKFAVARQLIAASDAAPLPEAPLAETLVVVVVHAVAARVCPQATHVSLGSLAQAEALDAVVTAHVVVLDGVTLAQVLERVNFPRRERLLVLVRPEAQPLLATAIDEGSAILVLATAFDRVTDPLQSLTHQLGSGASVGAAVRWLHRRSAPERCDARLYGESAMRFVRDQIPASRRQVTSLSFDVVGSTAVLRKVGDEVYAEMLAGLHARCTEIVRRHRGLPDDPKGNDGVMSYFGHPSAVEDAAEYAVAAGLEIVRAGAEHGLLVRVGIATGLVAVRAGQPVGLSIHLAARLQQVATPGTVVVAEATRLLVEHAFELRALTNGPELKGIDAEEPRHLVLGPASDAKSHRLERLTGLTPLVGRELELERLHECWRGVERGRSRVALVRAEAGMGKSRLVREFRGRLVRSGVKVLECRCRPDASASPYFALAEALRRWLGAGSLEAGPDARQALAKSLPENARDRESLDLLAGLLGFETQPDTPSPGRSRQRLQGLLLEWFAAYGKDQACCLIVEDWHWVDPSTREFVEHLTAERSGPGLLVVLTMRSESAAVLPTFAQADQIDLLGLPADAARELIGRVCAETPLPASVVRALAARADGVPLFLEEAARMTLTLGVEGAGFDVAAREAVPASLRDLLMARLDGLGPARQLAQIAAVLGREFSLALLSGLLEAGRFELDASLLAERLAMLEASGLVRAEGAGQYAFKHALVRDTAYASLWSRDRHRLHAEVVELLQRRWPEFAARRPELLAHHQTEAGLDAQALAQWEVAARSATARSAEHEAISHLRRAIEILGRLDPGRERDRTALRLQLLLAARLIATEGYGADAVSRAYQEAARLCDLLGDETARFKVEMGLEAYRFMRADFGPALSHGRSAGAIAGRSDDVRQRLQAHWGLACTLFHQGELRAAMREMEAGLAIYTPGRHGLFGVQDPGVMCLAYSSWGLWEFGRPDAALARIERAIAIAAAAEHKFSQSVALAYCVSVHLLRGEYDAAMLRADACIQVCEEAGFPVWLAITRCMRGRVLCERGDFDSGLAEMRAGYALWLSTGAMVSRPLYLSLQAEALMLAGETAAAAACIDDGLVIVSRCGERQLVAELLRLSGELALLRDERGEGEALLKRAYALALRQRRFGFALRSATALARFWADDGRQERARRLLVPLAARWQEGLTTRDVRVARAVSAALT